MKRRVIGLGAGGKLALKLPDGTERPIEASIPRPSTAYLAIDCSGSMAGQKLEQAKRGAEDFANSAVVAGYAVGLVEFSDEARVTCVPQSTRLTLATRLNALVASGGTNLTSALVLAASNLARERAERAIVVVTDGMPNDPPGALRAAKAASESGIRIIAIGTHGPGIYCRAVLLEKGILTDF